VRDSSSKFGVAEEAGIEGQTRLSEQLILVTLVQHRADRLNGSFPPLMRVLLRPAPMGGVDRVPGCGLGHGGCIGLEERCLAGRGTQVNGEQEWVAHAFLQPAIKPLKGIGLHVQVKLVRTGIEATAVPSGRTQFLVDGLYLGMGVVLAL